MSIKKLADEFYKCLSEADDIRDINVEKTITIGGEKYTFQMWYVVSFKGNDEYLKFSLKEEVTGYTHDFLHVYDDKIIIKIQMMFSKVNNIQKRLINYLLAMFGYAYKLKERKNIIFLVDIFGKKYKFSTRTTKGGYFEEYIEIRPIQIPEVEWRPGETIPEDYYSF